MADNKNTTEETSVKKTVIFWLRVVFYIGFAVVLPILIINWRFGLFSKVTKTTIGMWGLIIILLVGWVAITTYKWINKGIPYSYVSQGIKSMLGLPLIFMVLALVIYKLEANIHLVWQVLLYIGLSEGVAVWINPLPEWAHSRGIETQKGIVDTVLSKITNKEDK